MLPSEPASLRRRGGKQRVQPVLLFLRIDALLCLIDHPAATGAVNDQTGIGKPCTIFSLHHPPGLTEIAHSRHGPLPQPGANHGSCAGNDCKADKGNFFTTGQVENGQGKDHQGTEKTQPVKDMEVQIHFGLRVSLSLCLTGPLPRQTLATTCSVTLAPGTGPTYRCVPSS